MKLSHRLSQLYVVTMSFTSYRSSVYLQSAPDPAHQRGNPPLYGLGTEPWMLGSVTSSAVKQAQFLPICSAMGSCECGMDLSELPLEQARILSIRSTYPTFPFFRPALSFPLYPPFRLSTISSLSAKFPRTLLRREEGEGKRKSGERKWKGRGRGGGPDSTWVVSLS